MANARILIIAGDLLLAWDLAESLEREGYEVCSAPTEADGFRSAAWFCPDVTIVDTGMPGASHSADAATVQGGVQGAVIALTTSPLREQSGPPARSAPDALRKPFTELELLAKVAEGLSVKKLIFPNRVERPVVEAVA